MNRESVTSSGIYKAIGLSELPLLNKLLNSNDPEHLLQKAFALKESGKNTEALALLNKIASLENLDHLSHLVLARSYTELEKEQKALAEYGKTVQLKPDDKEYRWEYIRLLIKNKKYEDSVEQLNKLIQLDGKDFKAHLELVTLYQELDMREELYNEYVAISHIAPEHEKTLTDLAKMQTEKGLYKDSIQTYERLVKIDGNNTSTILNLSRLYFVTGYEPEAEKGFQQLVQLEPDNIEVLSNKGFQQIEKNNIDGALNIFAEALEKDKENIRAKFGIIAAYTRKGYLTTAIKRCEKLLEINDEIVPVQNRLAWLYGRKGIKLDEAVELSEKTLLSNPNSPDYLDTLSVLFFKKGDRVKAVELIEKAIELSPENLYYKSQLKKYTRKRVAG